MITLFEIIASNAGCTALLGKNPTRFTPFGLAQQNPQKPYVAYQLISGTPYNQVSCTPDADNKRYQIDVYADSAKSVSKTFIAIRNALEADSRVTTVSYNTEEYENDTGLYRVSFDIDFITSH